MTIDKHSWGFRREAKLADILTFEELIDQVVSTVSCGGMKVNKTKYST
jgi:alpha-L-fucosidase